MTAKEKRVVPWDPRLINFFAALPSLRFQAQRGTLQDGMRQRLHMLDTASILSSRGCEAVTGCTMGTFPLYSNAV